MAIQFFIEDVKKPNYKKRNTSKWLQYCISYYGKKCGDINYILCSDEYLRSINLQYLKHDYYTDIITFNNSEEDLLNADIFISTERVLDNSEKFQVSFDNEFYRVMIHGILHLIGYNDHTKSEKASMKLEEDRCLQFLQNFAL